MLPLYYSSTAIDFGICRRSLLRSSSSFPSHKRNTCCTCCTLYTHSQQVLLGPMSTEFCVTFSPLRSPSFSTPLLDHLQQLDVQLGAGRAELTDLNINVSALAELLPPGLSFRVARAHVGRFRVEISYSKLLTESLAIFLDDVRVEIAPSLSNTNEARLPGEGVDAAAREHFVSGLQGADVTDKVRGVDGAREAAAAAGREAKKSPLAGKDHIGEAGERMDFLAHWIEQITSKVKVVVNNLTVRVTPAATHLESTGFGERTSGDCSSMPCLEIRCSSLRWCDETPEVSSFMADQSASSGTDRAEGPGSANGGTVFAHKVRYMDCCAWKRPWYQKSVSTVVVSIGVSS